MNGAATDGVAIPAAHTDADLDSLGSRVAGVDDEARATARDSIRPEFGRLAEIAGWLAGVQQRAPAMTPQRPRCVLIGDSAGDPVGDAVGNDELIVMSMTDQFGVGVRRVAAGPAGGDAVGAGVAAADAEVDGGADLVVVVAPAPEADVAAAALVSLLSGVEPVALLPRGAAALDSAAWSCRAERLRDMRRAATRFRARPDALLAALGSPEIAAAAGFLLRATGRRTPLVLDGTVALAAALLVYDIAPLAAGWWQAADASPDPAHARACKELRLRPVLDLGMTSSGGAAGLLALPVVRAAAAVGR